MSAAQKTSGRTQVERTQATVGRLVQAARELFAARGYAATSLGEVAERAEVSKGALYHHFDGKTELFAAVYEGEQRLLAEVVEGAYHHQTEDPWAGLLDGCRVFFEASLDPGVQRITLLDAPSALGWERMRDIEARYSLALLKDWLLEAIAAGRIAKRPVKPLAHLLLGALCEGAMMVARAEDSRAETRRCLREVEHLLQGITIG